jgi:ArsR family transcriptional regulator
VRARRRATTNFYRLIVDELEAPARRLWQLAREQTQDWATLHQDELRLQRRLREREIDSQDFFAGAAADWDRLRRELYGEAFNAAALLALLPRELIVADLGCGTGATIESLAPHVARLIGIDNSPAMLKAARKRLARFTNVDVRKGDLQELPIDDACVDAALLILALTYVPEPQAVINQIARVLKPAGRVIVVDLLPHDRDDFRRQHGQLHAGFTEPTLTGLFTTAGLTPPAITRLPPEPNTNGPALFVAVANK